MNQKTIKEIIFITFVIFFIAFTLYGSKKKEKEKEIIVKEIKLEKNLYDRPEGMELEEYRKIKPAEYADLLKDYENTYFVRLADEYIGYTNENNRYTNGLYELRLENDIPVIYEIDFINNEKIIGAKTIFDNRLENDDWDYLSEYTIKYQRGSSMGMYVELYTREGKNNLRVYYRGGYLSSRKSKTIDEILVELSNGRKESQLKYIGTYKYEKIESIEGDVPQIDQNHGYIGIPFKEITIVFTETGNLYGDFFDAESNADPGTRSFYIINDEGFEIDVSFGDNIRGGGRSYFYFDNDYLIYDYDFTYDDHHRKYKIYYKRANGT
jgi:hypothetical protein